MAKTLNSLGVRAFLDEVYTKEGGYDRMVKLLEAGWTRTQIAREYSISRNYLNTIIKKIEEEKEL